MASDLKHTTGIRLHIDKSKYDTYFILHTINFNRFRDIAIARSTGTTRLRTVRLLTSYTKAS